MIYLDKGAKTPYYFQIYQQIQDQILQKKLAPGTVLMGCRLLSKELGVGRNTVDHAYCQLADEGYIVSKKGIGYIVQEIPDKQLFKSDSLFPLPQTELKKEDSFVYDLSYGNYSSRFFPANLWKQYINESFTDQSFDQINHYQDKHGALSLRIQLMQYLQQTRGVVCAENQIFITGGLQYTLELICKLLKPYGSFAMEEPGYNGALTVFQNNCIPVYPVPVDNEGLMVSSLPNSMNIKLIYITPSHHFPTGVTMSLERRRKLLQWAQRNNSYILEDDYESEYSYNNISLPSLQSIDTDDRVIYFGSFSESLSPSLRISYLLLPNRLLPIYNEKLYTYNCVVPWLNQYVLTKLIEKKHYHRLIRKMSCYFSNQHNLILEGLKKLSSDIRILTPGLGLSFILDFPPEYKTDWLIEKAMNEGVKVYSTEPFWQNKSNAPKNQLFLSFSMIETDNIGDCITRLKEAWFRE